MSLYLKQEHRNSNISLTIHYLLTSSSWKTSCYLSTIKPRPNDNNISTQHIPTLLAQHLQAPAKRWQHLNATDRNFVRREMLHAFSNPVATCCDMLRVENRTSAHAQAQHCCTNLAKRPQHHVTSTNVAWKIWPFSNLSQQHPTCRNSKVAKRTQHVTPMQQCWDKLIWGVAIVWPGLYNDGTETVKAPAKRWQHLNATYPNIFGSLFASSGQTIATLLGATCCVRLAILLRCVATCYDMLGVVGSNLKMVKFFMQHLWMLRDVLVVRPGSCNNVAPGHAH